MSYDANIANVSLLLHMDGANNGTTFLDAGPLPVIVSPQSGAKVSTAQSKFGGASLLLNGSSDYLTLSSSAGFTFGTGDFTIECWVRIAANPASGQGYGIFASASTLSLPSTFFISDTGKLAAWNNALVTGTNTGSSVPLNQWSHIAFTRASGTLRGFIDGVQQFAVSHTANYAEAVGLISKNPGASSGYFNGYIDELRITKGVARYTANFTPPTEAFPDRGPRVVGTITDASGNPASRTVRAYRRDTGALLGSAVPRDTTGDQWRRFVTLMLHADGANNSTTITDSSPTPKTVTANGDAKISTAQSKFGGASAFFDGTGDYLSIPHETSLDVGGSNFTVECWIRLDSLGSRSVISKRIQTGTSNAGWTLFVNGSGSVRAWNGTSEVGSANGIVFAGTWVHLAWVMNGSTLQIFAGGTSVYSGTFTISPNGYLMQIGAASFNGVVVDLFAGHIDDLRITKGVARYTSTFTPHTVAHPDYDNSASLNEYVIDTGTFTGEVNVICLDDSGGTLENDLIHRAYPV